MSALDAFRLDGKVAIVTGAGRGIGAGIARTFADAGANIVLTARTKEQLDEVAADVRAAGGKALVIPADVNDNDVLEEIVASTVEEFGRIDIVVNNAGGTMPRPFLDTSPGFFERSFHFNVTTAFVLSKAATPHLLASGAGSIVNISSAIGRLRDRGFVAYGTAKAALTHMTRLTAADLAPKVRVNAIAVGSIATSALETVLDNPEIHDEMVRRTPLKRLGVPEDIALCALYLASPAGQLRHRKAVRGRRRPRRGQPRARPPRPLAVRPTPNCSEQDRFHAPVLLPTVGSFPGLAVEEVVDLVGEGEAVLAAGPRDGQHDGVERDRSVHVRELARERVGRRFPAQLARQVGRFDAQQHEIGNVPVEPVGDVVHLRRGRAVDEPLRRKTRRAVLAVTARGFPLGCGRDVEDEAGHGGRAYAGRYRDLRCRPTHCSFVPRRIASTARARPR